MKTKISALALSVTLLAVSACSSVPMTPEEREIQERAKSVLVANAITVTELRVYDDVGLVKCEQRITYSKIDAEEECREKLKVEGARRGAELVIIESRSEGKCQWGSEQCATIGGRAYKAKAPHIK